jgi:MFS family permease
MGVYSSSQFFGLFLGGLLGGWLHSYFHLSSVFWMCGVLAFVWLLIALTMPQPQYVSSQTLRLPPGMTAHQTEQLSSQILQLSGVQGCDIDWQTRVVYLKIDSQKTTAQAVQQRIEEIIN